MIKLLKLLFIMSIIFGCSHTSERKPASVPKLTMDDCFSVFYEYWSTPLKTRFNSFLADFGKRNGKDKKIYKPKKKDFVKIRRHLKNKLNREVKFYFLSDGTRSVRNLSDFPTVGYKEWSGKVIDKAGDKYILKTVGVTAPGVEDLIVILPKYIRPFNVKNERILKQYLSHFSNIKYKFDIGEVVRYRDTKKLMREAIVTKNFENDFYFLDTGSDIIKVSHENIYKHQGHSKAQTIKFDDPWFKINFESHDKNTLELLNTMAKIQSHPEFKTLNNHKKLEYLTGIIYKLYPYESAGVTFEKAGYRLLEDKIVAGAGCCRISSAILGIAFEEAGFPVQMMKLNNKYGSHVWLEVNMKELDGTIKKYIVDPMFPYRQVTTAYEFNNFKYGFVYPKNDLSILHSKYKLDFAQDFFQNPNRFKVPKSSLFLNSK